MVYDQFDNSERARRLGVAVELLPKRYRVEAVITAIDGLLDGATIRDRCRQVARRLDDDGVSRACHLILQALESSVTGSCGPNHAV